MHCHEGDQRKHGRRTALELIQIALTEPDEHAAWQPIHAMQFRASRADFEAARALCQSADARERQLGANIVGQLGVPVRAFPEEALNLLLALLDCEDDTASLRSIVIALGHQHDPRIVAPVAALKDHPDAEVRYSIAFSLGGLDDDVAIDTLISLSSDVSAIVRDWATFALGSLTDRDDARVRNALTARLTDSDADTRAEAIAGLEQRGITPHSAILGNEIR
jgi:HEAT repeat protein